MHIVLVTRDKSNSDKRQADALAHVDNGSKLPLSDTLSLSRLEIKRLTCNLQKSNVSPSLQWIRSGYLRKNSSIKRCNGLWRIRRRQPKGHPTTTQARCVTWPPSLCHVATIVKLSKIARRIRWLTVIALPG